MDDDGAPGVPEWVVTYGDMMSLLLTFFIMLVSLSEVVADQKYRAILGALQQYVGYRTGPVAPPGPNFPLNNLIESMEMLNLGSFTNIEDGRGGIKTRAIEGNDYRVFRTREGTSLRIGRPVPFAPADTRLSEDARTELENIAAELAGKPNKIEIRAFASPDPLPADSPVGDKLVLVYERARNVLLLLESKQIAHDRMRMGMTAVSEPLSKTELSRGTTLDRVEVHILDAYASDFIGPNKSRN